VPRPLVRGARFHVQSMGAGPDVVLVHGLGSNLAFWYFGVAPLLAPDHHVVAYDLRGHGLSDATVDGYTTHDQAQDLLALLDHLGVRRPTLIGHSFGAAIALHAAAIDADAVEQVVVADGFLPAFEGRGPSAKDADARASVERLRTLGVDVPDDLPRVAYGVLADLEAAALHRDATRPSIDAGISRRALDRWRLLRSRTHVVRDVHDASLDAALLARVACPVRAVYGDRTPCAATMTALRSALPGLELTVVPDAGHLLPLLGPDRFVDASGLGTGRGTQREAVLRDA
jgi:pimeloyl-ACP methyl ester carboxylesterase